MAREGRREALDDTRPVAPGADRELVARLLEHHGVAAFTWSDGSVTWANDVACGLVAEMPDQEQPEFLLGRLSRSFDPPAAVFELEPGEDRVMNIELATTRALLELSAVVVRRSLDDGDDVLVTFRAPLEEAVDPGQVARLQMMLDSASDIITVIDHVGRIRFANPAAGRIVGVAGADAYGTDMMRFVHPEDEAAAADAFARGVLGGEDLEPFLVRLRMADGEWHHTEVKLAGPVDIGGTVGTVVTIRDVSDRVRRDAENQAHRQRLETIVENIDDVIVILSADLSVVWTSPGIERFVDAPAYTNVGEQAFNDMHPDDVPGVLAAIESAIESHEGRSTATFRLHHERFGWRWVEASVVNRLDDPAVEGLVCTLREVTGSGEPGEEHTRLRRQEREEMARLRETDRLKDRFLATVSHELRTPLTSVRGFSSLLQSQWDDLDAAQRLQLVDRIAANAVAMEEMIEQLLDFSRLQAGRVDVNLEPLALDEAVDEMVDALAHQLAEHEVVVSTGGLSVMADRHAFGHVLRNLLTNAARYSSAGTRIDVEAEAETDGGVVHLHVRDRGIGIAQKDQRRVFQSFFQSAPGATDRRGTGVGLNVARRYAQLQSGRLDLQSTLGEGTTVTFTLPSA